MIVSYPNGTDFLQANQALLQENPYLSTFFTLDAPLLKQADTINYALRCEQGDNWLLALKVEPYNLLLLGDEACVPELLRFLFDGGCELKNYLCASELGYVMQRELEPYGRRYEEALAMDFMEARTVTEPSAPEVETAGKGDLDEIFACAQRFVADCGLLDKPEKEPFRKVLDSFRILRADGKIVSMARIAPATQDDLRLVLVYTRDEYRGRGYARKVVNSAKNEILAAGKRVTLNVDRKNPVSYHLYLSLGFEICKVLFGHVVRDLLRVGAFTEGDEVRNAVDEDRRFAAARAGQQQQRALCGQDALELHGVEILKARGDDRAAGGQKSGFKCLFHSFTFASADASINYGYSTASDRICRYQKNVRSRSSAFFSIRLTWTCETPMSSATRCCVRLW